MAQTQVILLERVEKLGQLGDVVNVKPGYARNYLLPQKKALRASKSNIAHFEAQRKTLEAENENRRKEAEKTAKKIEGVVIPLIRQASEAGQLFGSVNARDIAAGASEVSGETVTRDMVQMNQNFKLIGLFPVEVALHPEVKVEVTINVARTKEEAEMQEKSGKALISDDVAAAEGVELADDVEAIAPEEAALEAVLEEDALEAEKEKQAEEAEAAAEEAKKAEEKAAAKAAEEAAKAEAAAEEAEEAPAAEEEAKAEEAPVEEDEKS